MKDYNVDTADYSLLDIQRPKPRGYPEMNERHHSHRSSHTWSSHFAGRAEFFEDKDLEWKDRSLESRDIWQGLC